MHHQRIAYHFRGGAIDAQTLHAILKKSYEPTLSDHEGYVVQRDISGKRAQVYHNYDTGHTIVAHKGTQSMTDWGTNLQFAAGYTGGARFEHGRKVQQQAADRFGTHNTTTVGHSLGAAIAADVDKNGTDSAVLDRPVRLVDAMTAAPDTRTDVRSTYDPISWIRPWQAGGKQVTIASPDWHPLTAHSPDQLLRLPGNQVL